MKSKNWKKNLIAAGVLVTVCAGIYLNWLYSGGEAKDLNDTLDAQKVMSDDMLILDGTVEVGTQLDTDTDYFSAVRLSRQQARDSAVTLLQETMASGTDAEVSTSNNQLEEIVQTALCEAQIESLVIAKGYTDCVAYMNEEGISVAVASPEGGLQQQDVALIADIVMTQSGQTYEQIRVVEVK
ncbi:MAG: SpoIIIAH-like family protein [Oscillospiraceae bacterium]|nr:SpoIIIAH-like family protein [Oscillospiraceae bacterium]